MLGLMIYALVDCVRYDKDMPVGLPKGVWVLAIVLLPTVGAIGWLVVSRVTLSDEKAAHTPAAPQRRGPIAPDDDPEFLASLHERLTSPGPSRDTDEDEGPPATSAEETPQNPDDDDDGSSSDDSGPEGRDSDDGRNPGTGKR